MTTTWTKDTSIKEYPALEHNIDTDVVIIGGGITGLLSAYTLSKHGLRVVVLEKNRIAQDATAMTTAILTQIIDTSLSDIIKMFGIDKAREIINSHQKSIDFIEEIIEREHIDCEFMRCNNYIYAKYPHHNNYLITEHQAAQALGIPAEYEPTVNLGFKHAGHIRIPNQAKFHPLKFLESLVEISIKKGVQIFEQTEALNIAKNSLTVHTHKANVHASWIISATYEPFGQPLGLFFKKGMYTSYVLNMELSHRDIPEGVYEDTANPYHYFRIDYSGTTYNRLIIGGEDHRSDIPSNPTKNFQSLENYARSTIPGTLKLVNKWSGPILEPSDGLAYIGPYKNKKIMYAMGFSGNGITYSAIASQIIEIEIVYGKKHNWLSIYDPARTPSLHSLIIKARDYFEELFNGVVKNFFKHRG